MYNSSAGSGKTFTLVLYYLSLALREENPYHFKRLLAMTFTNKAANEMKERVLLYLFVLSCEPNSEKYNASLVETYVKFTGLPPEKIKARSEKILQYILHNYSDLSILTIDKFVQRLVRTFAQELDLPFDLEIEPNFSGVSSVGIRDILNQAGNENEISEILTEYYLHTAENEKDINSLEKQLVEFSQILEKERSANQIGSLIQLDSASFKKAQEKIAGYLKKIDEELILMGAQLKDLLEKNGLSENDFWYKGSGIYSFFKKMMRFNGDFKQFDELQLGANAQKTIAQDKWESVESVGVSEAFKFEVLRIIDRVEDITTHERTRYLLFKELESQIYRLMMLKEIALRIAEIKEDNNLIFFNDFHRYVAEIIRSEPVSFIYERSGDRYLNLLLDEFQDTSELQWENLIPLVDNGLASGNINLIVGDAKQAIYRFRNGNVKQFVQLPEIGSDKALFSNEIKENFRREFYLENLDTNRRSAPEIIEFNNRVFGTIRDSILVGEMKAYYADCIQKSGAKITDGYVECNVLEEEKEEEKLDSSFSLTIRQIKDCLEDGFIPGDIALLLRGNKEINRYAERLMNEGIKVVSDEGLKLSGNKEVKTVTAILRLLVNPFAKGAAIDMLLAFHSASELPNLTNRFLKKSDNYNSYFDLDAYFALHFPQLEIKDLLVNNLPDLLHKLFHVLNYSPETNPFLEGMLDAVLDFSQHTGDNIYSFLDWWKEAAEKRSAIVPKSPDAVELVSIHKSKGLQFPVVICPLVNWKPNPNGEVLELVNISNQLEELPAALLDISKKRLENTDFQPLHDEESNYTILDNLNLLYVALTRPEKRLYVTAFSPDLKKQKPDHAGWMFAKGLGLTDVPSHTISFGSRVKLKTDDSSVSIEKPMPIRKTNWQEIVKIVTAYPEIYDSPRETGKILHLALERIKSRENVNQVVSQLIQEGYLAATDEAPIVEALNHTVNNPQLSDWFAAENKVLNEQELISAEGRMLRIDRLLIRDNQAVPLDFKTGIERDKDERQMIDYIQELNACGYSCKSGFLYYTHTQSLVEVAG